MPPHPENRRDGRHNDAHMARTPTDGKRRPTPPGSAVNHEAEHGNNGMIRAMTEHADGVHPTQRRDSTASGALASKGDTSDSY